MLFLLAFCSASIYAEDWEYKVVYLSSFQLGPTVEKEKNGAYLDSEKTRILNNLGKQGWELVSVTGDVGSDHAVYLKRRKKED